MRTSNENNIPNMLLDFSDPCTRLRCAPRANALDKDILYSVQDPRY